MRVCVCVCVCVIICLYLRGLARQGVPGDGQLTSTDQLVAVLTTIVYTCSVSHASTNFPQYEEYGFPPNYPGLLRGQPPRTKVSLYL